MFPIMPILGVVASYINDSLDAQDVKGNTSPVNSLPLVPVVEDKDWLLKIPNALWKDCHPS